VCVLLKFATVLYVDYIQLINLMRNHQWWLSNEIETLVKRDEQGVFIAGEGGEG
jgi:hypothetical protein